MIAKIRGYSGCSVELIKRGPLLLIRKSTSDGEYSQRLKKQVAKQEMFLRENSLTFIVIPKIVRKIHRKDYYSFDMEFFYSDDYISFFQTAEKSDIDLITERIIAFISENIEKSPSDILTKKIILSKYKTVREKIRKGGIFENINVPLLEKLDRVFCLLPDSINIPIGLCHGDLTFSNILINKRNKNIVLIDFLDNFIETPLQDITKIRQDTKYNWSLNLYQGKYDRTKIFMIMKYIDARISTHFERYGFYAKYYLLFQIMNFMRILPYAKSVYIVNYVERIIQDLAKKACHC